MPSRARSRNFDGQVVVVEGPCAAYNSSHLLNPSLASQLEDKDHKDTRGILTRRNSLPSLPSPRPPPHTTSFSRDLCNLDKLQNQPTTSLPNKGPVPDDYESCIVSCEEVVAANDVNRRKAKRSPSIATTTTDKTLSSSSLQSTFMSMSENYSTRFTQSENHPPVAPSSCDSGWFRGIDLDLNERKEGKLIQSELKASRTSAEHTAMPCCTIS